jgi:aryl-alcohol dehydrogenase-like predicted oxidoreductase
MNRTFVPSLGKHISQAGLGCVTFGREIDRTASFSIMDYALEQGITLFDTAAAYGGGASEDIVGQWFAEKGEAAAHVVLASKLLPPFDAGTLSAAVEQSLARLRMDRIDVLFVHSWHPSIEDEFVLRALNDLVLAGKVRALGVSNFNAEQLGTLLRKQTDSSLTPVSFIQNNQNYAVSHVNDGLRQLCRDFNVHIITYSPLAAGFLTGKYRGVVSSDVRFEIIPGHKDIYFNDRAWARLDQLMQAGEQAGKPVATLALAWAFHQPQVSSVLIGCRTPSHLDQALAALAEGDPGLPA